MVRDAVSPSRKGRLPKKSTTNATKPRSPGRSPSRKTTVSNTRITRAKAAPPSPRKAVPKTPAKKSSKESPKLSPKILRPRSPARPEKAKPVASKVIAVSDSESDSDVTSSSVQTRSRQASNDPSYDLVNNLRSRVQRDPIERASLMRSNYEPVKKFSEFSDEDEEPVVGSPSTQKNGNQLGFNILALIITLGYCLCELILTYLIPVLCNELGCVWRWPISKDVERIIASFDLSIFLSFTGFVLFNGILSIIPFGGRKYASMVPLDGNFRYILNGIFALILQIAVLITLEIYHIPVTLHIVNNYLKLITASVVLSFILGIILFIKSLYARRDKYSSTDKTSVLDKFISGGEINPRFGPLDVKFVTVRTCILAMIIFTLCLLYQSMEMISTPPLDPKTAETSSTWTMNMIQSIRIRPTLFVLSTLIFIYCCDQFCFESALFSMMEFKTVSWGFLKCNEYLTGSFIYCIVPKYIYDNNVELPSLELALCTALFLLGYVVYRGANSQKHAFRENPYNPICSKYISIPTTTGKKLLCSGYWGFVRHPNYLGDILMHLSFVRFVWATPLILLYIFIIGHLVVRAILDNKHCKKQYGAAWDRYCQRVPYLLIPKVF